LIVSFPITLTIIEYFSRFIEQNEKAKWIINSSFCRRCPEEDSGRTREVITAKYVRGEPVEFFSLTILVLDGDWPQDKKN